MTDTIYFGGTIYSVDGRDWHTRPAEALAVDSDGRIAAIGSLRDVTSAVSADAESIDLEGNTILPGFIDGHCHCPGTAITSLYEIYMYDCRTLEQTLEKVRTYIASHPDMDCYYGSGFIQSIDRDPRGPRRELLDAICPDKPILLYDTGGHVVWFNTKGLEQYGITKDTIPPQGGAIPLNEETGEPLGVVVDSFALGIPMSTADLYDSEQKLDALLHFQKQMLGWGFTGVMSIWMDFGVDATYALEADRRGLLKLRFNISHGAEPDDDIDAALAYARSLREKAALSNLVRMTTFKFYADGVAEGLTAYLSEPYPETATGVPDYRGTLHWEREKMEACIAKASAAGFQIHIHSIGDEATTEMLDIFEKTRAARPKADTRNVLTHLELVKPEDKRRMAALGVIASTQPFWHFKEPGTYEELDVFALGTARAERSYPVRSLIDEGVTVTFSADHPVTPINNPFWAIETAVTRNLYDGQHYNIPDIENADDPAMLRNAAERISVQQAIEAYTINGAYQLFRENEIGRLAPGKQADFIIIDKDPFRVDPVRISEINVLATVIKGEAVFRAERCMAGLSF